MVPLVVVAMWPFFSIFFFFFSVNLLRFWLDRKVEVSIDINRLQRYDKRCWNIAAIHKRWHWQPIWKLLLFFSHLLYFFSLSVGIGVCHLHWPIRPMVWNGFSFDAPLRNVPKSIGPESIIAVKWIRVWSKFQFPTRRSDWVNTINYHKLWLVFNNRDRWSAAIAIRSISISRLNWSVSNGWGGGGDETLLIDCIQIRGITIQWNWGRQGRLLWDPVGYVTSYPSGDGWTHRWMDAEPESSPQHWSESIKIQFPMQQTNYWAKPLLIHFDFIETTKK